MSVVAVKKYEDKIVVAADNIVVSGWNRNDGKHFKQVKMEKINDMIIGFSGCLQEGSLFLSYAATHKPDSSGFKDMLKYAVEFRKWKKDYDISEPDNNEKDKIINQYLVVWDGHVFCITGYDLVEIKDYYAIGCGEDFALAALHLGHSPQEAVKVACDISCFVAEPIIEETMFINIT